MEKKYNKRYWELALGLKGKQCTLFFKSFLRKCYKTIWTFVYRNLNLFLCYSIYLKQTFWKYKFAVRASAETSLDLKKLPSSLNYLHTVFFQLE